MSLQEPVRRHSGRRGERDRQAKRTKHRKKVEQRATREAERALIARQYQNDNQVLTFRQWCLLNGFSVSTGRRIIERGEVIVTQLSPRRIGISVGNNRRWQESRARGAA
jgi:hypothetical protein